MFWLPWESEGGLINVAIKLQIDQVYRVLR